MHAFKYTHDNNELYFIWEAESGSLCVVDYAAFLVSKKLYENLNTDELADYNSLDNATIKEIEKEIKELDINMDTSLKSIRKDSVIKAMCLHICHDCNLRCKYCFASEGTYNTERDYMSYEVGKQAIDFLIKHSGARRNLEIDFFGGEPLLNLDVVKKIVSYAREKEKKLDKVFLFTMTTNGVLLDEDTINYLNNEMENVVISIDGRADIHNKCRMTASGADCYNVIMDNAKKFKKLRGNKKYYIRGTFTSNNLDFSRDAEHLSDQGFDQISLEPVVLDYKHTLAIKEEHLDTIIKEYEKLTKIYIERRRGGRWFNFFHYMIDLDTGPCIKKRIVGCGAGVEYLAVTPTGDIYPCHQFVGDDKYCMGSVYADDFDRKIQGHFASSDLFSKPDCLSCWAKYYCSGGCAANNTHYEKDINKPYRITCAMMKKRLEMAMAVYAIENNKVSADCHEEKH